MRETGPVTGGRGRPGVCATRAGGGPRVRRQGDLRPMADDRSAMAELRNILVSREPLYARASAVVDTAGLSVDAAAARLVDAVAPVLHDKHAFGLRSAAS